MFQNYIVSRDSVQRPGVTMFTTCDKRLPATDRCLVTLSQPVHSTNGQHVQPFYRSMNYEYSLYFNQIQSNRDFLQHYRGILHRVSKKLCQCYFLNNSVKHWPTLIIFGMRHREET